MFPHPRGPPYKCALRVLAQRHLRRAIQGGAHDSVADARAAVDLALLKVARGAFGARRRAGGRGGSALLWEEGPRGWLFACNVHHTQGPPPHCTLTLPSAHIVLHTQHPPYQKQTKQTPA